MPMPGTREQEAAWTPLERARVRRAAARAGVSAMRAQGKTPHAEWLRIADGAELRALDAEHD